MEQPAVTKLGGRRGLLIRVGHALRLTWQAGPLAATLYLLMTISQGILPAAMALLTAELINAIAQAPATPDVHPLVLVAGIGALGVLLAVMPYGFNYVRSRINRSITLVAQDQLYRAVNGFDGMARFENPAFLDRLRLAQQSATMAPDQVTTSVFSIVQNTVTIVSFLVLLSRISVFMTAVTVLAAIPTLFVQLSISRKQADMMWTVSPWNRRQLFYQMLMLDLSAVKEVRLFGLGDFLARRMRNETKEINKAEERLDRRILTGQGPFAALGAIVAMLGLVLLISGVFGNFVVGDITLFISAVAGVQGAMSGIISGLTDAYEALLLFGHYVDVSRMESDLPTPKRPVKVEKLAKGLVLEDVWFRYTDDGPWVLRGVNLSIPFGRSTALVGLNGAGKSTIVKLLCRLYDPTKGSIKWDGTDIRQYRVAEYRDHISAVFQDYMSYDLPAKENIGIGDLSHLKAQDRIETAAKEAGVHDFIAGLAHGYDTMLSRVFFHGDDNKDPQQGITLSGGQWQRMALARALMRAQRDLLILDEPSAGLDADAEQALHDMLREYRKGATSVLISHRLGSVRRADRIVVLEAGRITEEGSHAELMRSNGEYARLFTIQASNYVNIAAGEGIAASG